MRQLKILLIFLTAISLNNKALADEVQYLSKDSPAPYTGILIPVEKAQELRKDALDLQITKQINLSLTRSVDLYKANEELYDKKITLLNDYNLKLSEALNKSNNTSTLEKAFYFGLGAVIVGFTSYGIYKAAVAK